MRHLSLDRPIRFQPAEISALVNERVVSRHAEEAAFLWTQRDRAVREPHYSLGDLAALDERVEAQLDGLRVAGDVGWTCCRRNLINEGPGEAFAVAALAFGGGNRERMVQALQTGCASPVMLRGLLSALGWLDYEKIAPWLQRLVEARLPEHRAVGIAAFAIQREDPGEALTAAVNDADHALRARAFRAVGELKRRDLLVRLREHSDDQDEQARFWASWSLTANGQREGVRLLTRWFEAGEPFAERALHLSLRAMHLDECRTWITYFSSHAHLARLAVIAAGITGDPACIPWLVRRMDTPELARLAGESFTMITGVDLEYHDLSQDAPLPSAPDDDMTIEQALGLDYESNLPWPSPGRIREWWNENAHAFSAGTRYLAGKPITRESALGVLASGKQRQRAAAALELALMEPRRPLFEVRARGALQQQRLAAWTS